MPIRRCSGLSTKNSPPRLQKAWPPSDCSGSCSSSSTRLPASATSAAAARPARPAPTTITSLVSTAVILPRRLGAVVSQVTGESPQQSAARCDATIASIAGRAPRQK